MGINVIVFWLGDRGHVELYPSGAYADFDERDNLRDDGHWRWSARKQRLECTSKFDADDLFWREWWPEYTDLYVKRLAKMCVS